MCGGNGGCSDAAIRETGLSPRVRGKPSPAACCRRAMRSIPACAGETSSAVGSRSRAWVYPRVCGGNTAKASCSSASKGLSPRVRGKRGTQPEPRPYSGSIPACAGETHHDSRQGPLRRVYPRVCGGNFPSSPLWGRKKGLSPRVRGKRNARPRASLAPGSIPACAGETGRPGRRRPRRWVYPRVCGGNQRRKNPPPRWRGLSPRVRGKHQAASLRRRPAGSIPACAGETFRRV